MQAPPVPPDPLKPPPTTTASKTLGGFTIPTSVKQWVHTAVATAGGAFIAAATSAISSGGIPATEAGWVSLAKISSAGALTALLAYLKTTATPPQKEQS